MGRFSRVGWAFRAAAGSAESWAMRYAWPALRMSGALGQGSTRVAGASNLWTTSLHGPFFTCLGFAWRRSRAVPSSLIISLKLVGGFALTRDASPAAA